MYARAPLLVDLWPFRLIVLAIAIASIVLAAVAAFVQDDIEHILGYSIVGDAGVVMLALATLDPAAWAPARTWILVFVVARSAFAAWAAGDPGRVLDRPGRRPARLGPALAAPRGRVRAGRRSPRSACPGLVAFDARAALVELALDAPLATFVLLATLAPLAYYGRLLAIGLARPDRVSRAEPGVAAAADRPGHADRSIRLWFARGLGRQPGVHDGGARDPARRPRARDIGRGLRRLPAAAAAGLAAGRSRAVPGELVAPIDVQRPAPRRSSRSQP